MTVVLSRQFLGECTDTDVSHSAVNVCPGLDDIDDYKRRAC